MGDHGASCLRAVTGGSHKRTPNKNPIQLMGLPEVGLLTRVKPDYCGCPRFLQVDVLSAL